MWFYCWLLCTIVIAITLVFTDIKQKSYQQGVIHQRSMTIDHIAGKIEKELADSSLRLKTLAAVFSITPLMSRKDFDTISRDLWWQKPYIKGVYVAPDTTVQYIYPYIRYESLLGKNALNIGEHAGATLKTKNINKVLLKGPVTVENEENILILMMPILQSGKLSTQTKKQPMGIVSILIDVDSFFNFIGKEYGRYDVSVRRRYVNEHAAQTFYGKLHFFNNDEITHSIKVPGGIWQIAAHAKQKTQAPSQTITNIQVAGLVSLIALLIFFYFRIKHMKKEAKAGKQLEIALSNSEKANLAKSHFLANMSHELRTPLNAVIGFSDIISNMPETQIQNQGKKVIEYALDINESGRHLLSIINDILDLSKVESGSAQVAMGDIFLQDIIDQSIRQIRGLMAEGEISSTITIPDDLPPIRSDERILRQIFLNLLSNAIKFTPKGGKITLSAQATKKEIIIILTDTGIGMSQDELEIALEPFGQVESYLIKRHQGTGLGLPLVKSFVELLNGIFNIKSNLGVGTEVTLIFPIGHNAV